MDAVADMLRGMLERVAPPEVKAAYLFGSVARGTATQDSDVDLAILCDPSPPATLAGTYPRLADELTALLGRRVDLIVLNGAPLDLVHRVLRDGHLLLERDPDARVRFEVRARSEYLDLLPVLRRYRRLDERGA